MRVRACVRARACVYVCVYMCVYVRARAFLAVIELLLGSVLKVGFYIMKWNVVTYKCACVCVCVCMCVLNFYFAYLSLKHRTIFVTQWCCAPFDCR